MTGFTSNTLNPDYGTDTIAFERGWILAYENTAKINIVKNYEELEEVDSIFAILKKNDLEVPMVYSLEEDKIKIMVSDEIYNAFSICQKENIIKEAAASVFVLPALIYMLEMVRDNPDTYSAKAWFSKIDSGLKNQIGKSLLERLEDDNCSLIKLAQEILEWPVNKLMKNISDILKGAES